MMLTTKEETEKAQRRIICNKDGSKTATILHTPRPTPNGTSAMNKIANSPEKSVPTNNPPTDHITRKKKKKKKQIHHHPQEPEKPKPDEDESEDSGEENWEEERDTQVVGEKKKKKKKNKKENRSDIWYKSDAEEKQRIREFWLQLGEEDRRALVKLEKEAVLKKMKEQQKQTCSCTVCGRKRTVIEEELEILYDAYYEELENFANDQVHGKHHSTTQGPSSESEDYDDEDDEVDDHSSHSGNASIFEFGSSLTVKGGLLTVADDFLKNDGRKFLDLMEQLAERKIRQLDEDGQNNGEWDEPYDDEEEDEDDEEYDDEDEEDTMTEEQRMEEGRRMFQIFAAKMFEQRVLTAYREKVAQERQQRFLEELEEEERLKELKEEHRMRVKEKKKALRKLQKQQKDEERLAKERERLAEEEKIRKEKEKKAEEERLKREAERARREEERRLREEAERQRKEAERLRKEEEKRRQRENEEKKRREREERERREREERERKEKKDKEERERKEREEKERRDREEKERRDREEKERKDLEEKRRKEREEAERKEREELEKEEQRKIALSRSQSNSMRPPQAATLLSVNSRPALQIRPSSQQQPPTRPAVVSPSTPQANRIPRPYVTPTTIASTSNPTSNVNSPFVTPTKVNPLGPTPQMIPTPTSQLQPMIHQLPQGNLMKPIPIQTNPTAFTARAPPMSISTQPMAFPPSPQRLPVHMLSPHIPHPNANLATSPLNSSQPQSYTTISDLPPPSGPLLDAFEQPVQFPHMVPSVTWNDMNQIPLSVPLSRPGVSQPIPVSMDLQPPKSVGVIGQGKAPGGPIGFGARLQKAADAAVTSGPMVGAFSRPLSTGLVGNNMLGLGLEGHSMFGNPIQPPTTLSTNEKLQLPSSDFEDDGILGSKDLGGEILTEEERISGHNYSANWVKRQSFGAAPGLGLNPGRSAGLNTGLPNIIGGPQIPATSRNPFEPISSAWDPINSGVGLNTAIQYSINSQPFIQPPIAPKGPIGMPTLQTNAPNSMVKNAGPPILGIATTNAAGTQGPPPMAVSQGWNGGRGYY